MPNGSTGEPTVYASVHLANQHPFMLAQFRDRGIMLDRYMTMTPEVERDVAHALSAQRDYAESVKNKLSFGGVDFDAKRDGDKG